MTNIKEIALKVGLQAFEEHPYDKGRVVSPSGYTWIDDKLIEFAEALIESYKAELLKGVGEPVLYAEFAEDGGWLGDASEYTDHLEEPHALYTSEQLRQRVQELEKQRDELLAALERCRFALEPYDDIKPRDWKSDRLNLRDAHQVAVAAIANMKGEQ